MKNFIKKKKEEIITKKREAKGRLASGEIHALVSQDISNAADQNRARVIQHIESTYPNITGPLAEWARDNMVSLLEKAELTINFRAHEFFNSPPSKSYQNYYERSPQYTGYGSTRERAEQKLFKYNSATALTNIQEIIDRITKRGNHNDGSNQSFAPTIRPRYAALNIFEDPSGPSSAHKYGHSVLVLKEHMKHKCTFTFNDSFLMKNEEPLANYLHFDKVLVDMDKKTFDCLYKKAHNIALQADEKRGHPYIEAQIHNDILFSRDVETMRLSRMELAIGADEAQIRNRIESITLFAIKNKIKVELIS